MGYVKWTSEILTPVFAASLSYAQVLKKLGLRLTGGSHANLKRLAGKYGIDRSHFLGRSTNSGPSHKGGPKKKTPLEVLILRPALSNKQNPNRLRRALIARGRAYVCGVCGLGPEWNGRPLALQIDHRNGKRWDDREKNIRFICPNCHTQTVNFGSRNNHVPKKIRECQSCKSKITRYSKSGMCSRCAQRNRVLDDMRR